MHGDTGTIEYGDCSDPEVGREEVLVDDVMKLVWDGSVEPAIREEVPVSETARARELVVKTVRAITIHPKGPTVTSSDDGGYVHDPSAFDEDGDRHEDDEEWVDDPAHPEAVDREFDWRGWTLVGVMIFAFIVAPVLILLVPPGTEYRFALIILPLFPAVLLAITAVWATTRP